MTQINLYTGGKNKDGEHNGHFTSVFLPVIVSEYKFILYYLTVN